MDSDDRFNVRFVPDDAITKPSQDSLGYNKMARDIEQIIIRSPTKHSMVISINGAWGSGKSSLINLINYWFKLENPANIRIIHFEPWLTSGHRDLVMRLLIQLYDNLNPLAKTGELGKKILKYVSYFRYTPNDWLKSLGDLADGKLKNEASPEELKKKINDELSKSETRYFIIIDDVDRLLPDEIRELFRAIKSVTDFENVTYVIAFDYDVVVKALDSFQAGKGDEYLAKIIQIPFYLPRPDPFSLKAYLERTIQSQISTFTANALADSRWDKLFELGLSHLNNTPRKVIRLVNDLFFIYPRISDNVNLVDLVALESIKLSCPSFYDHIHFNLRLYASNPFVSNASINEEKITAEFYNKAHTLINESDRPYVSKLIFELFPIVKNAYGGPIISESEWYTYRSEKRICTEYADAYFDYCLPRAILSNKQTRDILDSIKQPDIFCAEMAALSRQIGLYEGNLENQFISRLNGWIRSDIPVEDTDNLIRCLLLSSDQISSNNPYIQRGIARTILRFLIKMGPEDERAKHLKALLLETSSISVAADVIMFASILQDDDATKVISSSPDNILLKTQISELEQIILTKIDNKVRKGTLIDCPNLFILLSHWNKWGGTQSVKEWVDTMVVDDQDFLKIIKGFLFYEYSSIYMIPIIDESIDQYIDIDEARTRINNMLKKNEIEYRYVQAARTFSNYMGSIKPRMPIDVKESHTM